MPVNHDDAGNTKTHANHTTAVAAADTSTTSIIATATATAAAAAATAAATNTATAAAAAAAAATATNTAAAAIATTTTTTTALLTDNAMNACELARVARSFGARRECSKALRLRLREATWRRVSCFELCTER